MPGLMSIREKYAPAQAAHGRAHHRLVAHDDPDGGADRDARRSRRRCALGELQHFLARRTTPRPRSRRPACRSSPGKARRSKNIGGAPIRRFRSRTAKARNSSSMTAATSRCSSTKATSSKKAATGSTRRAATTKSRSSRICSRKCSARIPYRWHEIVKEWRGVSEETTTGVHRLYQMLRSRASCSSPPST